MYEELNVVVLTPAEYYNIRNTDATTTSQIRDDFQVKESRGPVRIFSMSRLIIFILGILLLAAVTAIVLLLILYRNEGNYCNYVVTKW